MSPDLAILAKEHLRKHHPLREQPHERSRCNYRFHRCLRIINFLSTILRTGVTFTFWLLWILVMGIRMIIKPNIESV
jgi:hypothetical protein